MNRISALIVIMLMFFAASSHAQSSGEAKVRYQYKKYQKFDFEDIAIEGDTGNPGDLSIASRYQRKFKNRLPYRVNFNPEIARAVERVR
ncbi:MAG: hypothetical protein CME71_03145 [Halobacteriovorax sp.]|nr:hypothetical protein [Halobacteriovorax sp.]